MKIPYGTLQRFDLSEDLHIVGVAEKTIEDADITGERIGACWNLCLGIDIKDIQQGKVEIVKKESMDE